jgi:hypothetical protein
MVTPSMPYIKYNLDLPIELILRDSMSHIGAE